jgi:hypothetical protein
MDRFVVVERDFAVQVVARNEEERMILDSGSGAGMSAESYRTRRKRARNSTRQARLKVEGRTTIAEY